MARGRMARRWQRSRRGSGRGQRAWAWARCSAPVGPAGSCRCPTWRAARWRRCPRWRRRSRAPSAPPAAAAARPARSRPAAGRCGRRPRRSRPRSSRSGSSLDRRDDAPCAPPWPSGTGPPGRAAAGTPAPATAAPARPRARPGCRAASKCSTRRLGVRLAPGEQIERDQADREQVGGEVRFGAQHLLGREVTGRAHHVVGLGQPRLALAHRDAEVRQPQMRPAGTGGLQQDVRRLDVPVHHALRVHRGQPGQQLVQQDAHEPRRQRAVVADQMRQRAAAHQVHGEQHLVVVRGPARRGQHMRMVDPQRLLADEAQQRVRVALLQHLGRDVAAAPVVPGAPDRARPRPARSGRPARTGRRRPHPWRPVRCLELASVPGWWLALVRLVVGDRVRGPPGTVHPEELCQFGVSGGEGVRRIDDVPGVGDRPQQRLDLAHHAPHRWCAPVDDVCCAVLLSTEPPAVFLISSMRSVASAALTLPSATWPARSCSACTRCTTAGLPIFARCPLISCDSIGADSPSTAASRAWLRPRSSMRRRNSAPSGSPYQLRCSSRARAVASCCAASIPSPLSPRSLRCRESREASYGERRCAAIPGRESGRTPGTLVREGALAQLVERCLCMADVRGSTPLGSTI